MSLTPPVVPSFRLIFSMLNQLEYGVNFLPCFAGGVGAHRYKPATVIHNFLHTKTLII